MAKKRNIAIQIVSIVFLSALLITFTNLGITLFIPEMDRPNERCFIQPDKTCGGVNCTNSDGTCKTANFDEFENQRDERNQTIFLILGGIGIILIIASLFLPDMIRNENNSTIVLFTGLATGFILIIEGMIRNSNATTLNFITSGILIVISIFLIFKLQKK